MPRVVFSVDPIKIAERCISYFIKEDWYKKQGYDLRVPEIPEEIKKDLIKSEELIRKNEYDQTEYFEAFKKIYDKEEHEKLIEKIEPKWKKIEKDFFERTEKIVGKKWPYDEYFCYLSFYGTGGSYWKNSILIKAQRKNVHKTIAHELIHTLVNHEIWVNRIPHWTKERIVDLYLAKTELRKLFDHPPKIQHASKKMKVDEIFEKSTKIKDIIEGLGSS